MAERLSPDPVDAKRILVIDDDRDICTALSLALRAQGYEVETAAGGHEALRRLGPFRPDLVILDIMMPGMDGFAVFQAITERVEGRLPFLFITATALRVGEEWLRGIPHATMHKPLDFDLLFERVHQLLSASK